MKADVAEKFKVSHASVAGASTEFADLLRGLLTKSPGSRMGWAELAGHPFWNAPLELLQVPFPTLRTPPTAGEGLSYQSAFNLWDWPNKQIWGHSA